MFDIRVSLFGLAVGAVMVAMAMFWLLISIQRDTAKLRGIDLSRAFEGKVSAILLTLSLILFAVLLVMLIWILR